MEESENFRHLGPWFGSTDRCGWANGVLGKGFCCACLDARVYPEKIPALEVLDLFLLPANS